MTNLSVVLKKYSGSVLFGYHGLYVPGLPAGCGVVFGSLFISCLDWIYSSFLLSLCCCFYETALVFFLYMAFYLLQRKGRVGMLYTRRISTFSFPLFYISFYHTVPSV